MRKYSYSLAVSKPNKPSSSSGGEIRYFDRIHVDLVVDILSKLPTKDIAKCRCISKLWSSIIRIPNYNLLFPIKYPVTPRLLFAFQHSGKVFFSSSPQPQNPGENSSLVATHYDQKNSVSKYSRICNPVMGLVSCQYFYPSDTSVVVSNPMTGEYVTLPKLNRINKSEWPYFKESFSFSYDPIDKQFKVLNITWPSRLGKPFTMYRVLTLGPGKGNWREIQCDGIYFLPYHDIGINGVLYYTAKLIDNEEYTYIIVCFDVRSEKFSFINVDQDMEQKIQDYDIMMIDFKGKLGACNCNIKESFVELWVLEDAEKHKWSKHTYEMPRHPWLNIKNMSSFFNAGMTSSGEIILYPCTARHPFFIFYINLERNIFTKVNVELPNFEFFLNSRVHLFLNYFEDVRFMQVLSFVANKT